MPLTQADVLRSKAQGESRRPIGPLARKSAPARGSGASASTGVPPVCCPPKAAAQTKTGSAQLKGAPQTVSFRSGAPPVYRPSAAISTKALLPK